MRLKDFERTIQGLLNSICITSSSFTDWTDTSWHKRKELQDLFDSTSRGARQNSKQSLVSLEEDESVSFTVLIAASLDSKSDKSLYLPSVL